MKPKRRSFVFSGLLIVAVGVALASGGLQIPKFLNVFASVGPQAAPVVQAPEAAPDQGVRGARLQTSKASYLPDEVVYVAGDGWQPNEVVTFYLSENPELHL